MMNDPFKVLSLTETASEEQVREAYQRLKKKYSEERFLEGEAGNKAAKNLTELETAYEQILLTFSEKKAKNEEGSFSEIERLIKEGKVDEAQRKLDALESRTPAWHYYQSIIFYKKRWYTESKRQLEFACNGDPSNAKYRDALNKLNQVINGNNQQMNGNPNGGNQQQRYQQQQMNQSDPASQMGTCCCELMICDACCPLIDLNPCC